MTNDFISKSRKVISSVVISDISIYQIYLYHSVQLFKIVSYLVTSFMPVQGVSDVGL